MPSLKSFAVEVAAGIVVMLLWTAGTAVFGRFDLQFAAGLAAIALAAGLPVLAASLFRQGRQTALDVQRLERAALPDWIRPTADAANRSGIKVFRVEGNVVFENTTGERHVAAANPPGSGLLERERTLTVLEGWGVPMRVVGMESESQLKERPRRRRACRCSGVYGDSGGGWMLKSSRAFAANTRAPARSIASISSSTDLSPHAAACSVRMSRNSSGSSSIALGRNTSGSTTSTPSAPNASTSKLLSKVKMKSAEPATANAQMW
jgi:hypothetical protein